jgi:Mce-associated membrane protein
LAGTNHRADGQQAALQAAVREAVNLTTISYTSADRDLSRIIAGATGNLRTQFDHERAQFPGVLSGEKSVSRGTVLRAGLQSFTGTTAIALVAVDATVSNTASVAAGTPSVVKHYRMVMTLRLVRGTWLVSDVAFAGLPQ